MHKPRKTHPFIHYIIICDSLWAIAYYYNIVFTSSMCINEKKTIILSEIFSIQRKSIIKCYLNPI